MSGIKDTQQLWRNGSEDGVYEGGRELSLLGMQTE